MHHEDLKEIALGQKLGVWNEGQLESNFVVVGKTNGKIVAIKSAIIGPENCDDWILE